MVKKNRAIWEQKRITDYSVTSRCLSMWQGASYHLIVQDSAVSSFTVTCINTPLSFEECKVAEEEPESFTVEGFFDRVANIESGTEKEFLTVEYDPEFGYPAIISFNDPKSVDEEYSCMILEFQPGEGE
jgi:hypothetical protein